ncbi:hypothetical protein LAV79_05320 [Peribacillus butanolivorans]|uniref:hypothetical protein n=1 Tax=Peribacillus butanolivorans TaxID=421767 RepID=UPI0030C9C04E
MTNIEKAITSIQNAYEIRGNKTGFLKEEALPIRDMIKKIKGDTSLSPKGKAEKIGELKKEQTEIFMRKVSLRKQEYQRNLQEAKTIAKSVIESNVIYPDDATKLKFSRELSELKFKISMLDTRASMKEIASFVDNLNDAGSATLLLESFHEIAGKFSDTSNADGFKSELTQLYKRVQKEFTPEEVIEAEGIIEAADSNMNNRLFTLVMPGDNPSLNPEFSLINEVFSREATRFYQEPEAYYDSKGLESPTLAVDQKEEKAEKAKEIDPEAQRYIDIQRRISELLAQTRPNNDGGNE